jgi:hypothetical protein
MDKSLEKELIGLEQEYWQSMKKGDVDTMLRLTQDPCIVTGPQGISRIDHATLAKMAAQPNWKLDDFKLDSIEVEQIDDGVAIIGYKVHEELTVDGKPVSLDAADTSTWVKKNGEWQCAMHTEALAGDPFGRDRKMQ